MLTFDLAGSKLLLVHSNFLLTKALFSLLFSYHPVEIC